MQGKTMIGRPLPEEVCEDPMACWKELEDLTKLGRLAEHVMKQMQVEMCAETKTEVPRPTPELLIWPQYETYLAWGKEMDSMKQEVKTNLSSMNPPPLDGDDWTPLPMSSLRVGTTGKDTGLTETSSWMPETTLGGVDCMPFFGEAISPPIERVPQHRWRLPHVLVESEEEWLRYTRTVQIAVAPEMHRNDKVWAWMMGTSWGTTAERRYAEWEALEEDMDSEIGRATCSACDLPVGRYQMMSDITDRLSYLLIKIEEAPKVHCMDWGCNLCQEKLSFEGMLRLVEPHLKCVKIHQSRMWVKFKPRILRWKT